MHITLINPPFTFSNRDSIVFSQCLGILYIAAYLKEKGGHIVSVIDGLFEGRTNIQKFNNASIMVGLTNNQIMDRIPINTDLIGLSVPFSHLASIAHNLANDIKLAFPSIPLVMGGVYPSTQPELAIQSKADFIVIGEGELVMCGLAEWFTNKEKKRLPKGLLSRTSSPSLYNTESTYVQNVNVLPFPARSLLPVKQYFTHSQRNRRGWITSSIITSRGCPYDCEFCSVHSVCGYKWRPRSPENILAEIDELVGTYGVNNLEIEDDNFTLKHDRAMEILNGIIERNKNKRHRLSWQAPNGLRIDTLGAELMDIIKKSNCQGINLALEHGDEEMLKTMKKKLSLSKVVDVVKLVNKFEITATVFIIYGYPGESRKRFETALKFYLQLKEYAPRIDFAFFLAQPYPGTELFKRCVQEGYIESVVFDDIDSMSRFSTENKQWLKTDDFDEEELKWRRNVLTRKLTPRIYLRNKIKNILPSKFVTKGRFFYHTVKRFTRVK